MDDTDHYRCRLISLKQSSDKSKQAEAACEVLAGLDGVLLAAPTDSFSIHLIYSLNQLSLELIIDLLNELGFELDKSILVTLQKTIFQFLETNARDNMQVDVTSFQIDLDDAAEVPDQTEEKYWEDYR